jgi:hypothetical protein
VRRATVLFCLVLVGCGDELLDGVRYDLDVTPTDFRLAAGDATPLGDLSGLSGPVYDLSWDTCVGTSLAGTCVAQFFTPFASCFAPSGHCSGLAHSTGVDVCWENAASTHQYMGPLPSFSKNYWMGSTLCLSDIRFAMRSDHQLCRPGDADCRPEHTDGFYDVPSSGGAHYDPTTGIFVCPDGETVNVGSSFSACPALAGLLNPACDGGLPIGSCTPK